MIRPYGPGKFNTIVDKYVFEVASMADADLTLGTTWYALLRHGHTVFLDHDPDLTSLTEEERELIRNSAGMIVSENNQGFVDVTYYDTMPELDQAWGELETDLEEENR